jgi:hypothetical protein
MYYRTRLAHDLKVDEEKIQRLTDLGLDMKGGLKGDPNIPAKKVSFNKREANWEANFLLIQQYKEEFGLSAFLELKQKSASHGMYKHLYNWVRIFFVYSLLLAWSICCLRVCSHPRCFCLVRYGISASY